MRPSGNDEGVTRLNHGMHLGEGRRPSQSGREFGQYEGSWGLGGKQVMSSLVH
jgi:hypothetical protein